MLGSSCLERAVADVYDLSRDCTGCWRDGRVVQGGGLKFHSSNEGLGSNPSLVTLLFFFFFCFPSLSILSAHPLLGSTNAPDLGSNTHAHHSYLRPTRMQLGFFANVGPLSIFVARSVCSAVFGYLLGAVRAQGHVASA